jgi:O-antigen/teichoic acid export membrane protein
VVAFFATQVVISLLQTSAMATALWRALPPSPGRSRFRREMVASTWRFTAGTTAISVTAVVLTQADKVLVSGILPLREFGYYSLASQVAASVLLLVAPVYAGVFPRLSALVATPGPRDDLAALYNKACQVVAILVLPTAAVLAAFSTQVLLMWTGSAQTAAGADTVMSILLIGSALNGLCFLPFALQLAHGWTRLALAQNVISIVVLIPAVVGATLTYGSVGAAAMWLIVNLGYVTIFVRVMHRRILPAQRAQWYRRSFLAPTFAVAAIVLVGRLAEPELHPALQLAWIACVFACAVAAAVAATGSASWFVPRLANTLARRRPIPVSSK